MASKKKRTSYLIGLTLLGLGGASAGISLANASPDALSVVSAVDNPAPTATIPAPAVSALLQLGADSRGVKVGDFASSSVYLSKAGSNLCVVLSDGTGACGSRDNLIRNGGVYLITGTPGALSAMIVVPDGISTVTLAGKTVKPSNNVAFFQIDGKESAVQLSSTSGRSYNIDLGSLIPPKQ